MNREDIIRMAREAGSIDSEGVIETVWNAFSAAEREACAQVCDLAIEANSYQGNHWTISGCAKAIRARNNT